MTKARSISTIQVSNTDLLLTEYRKYISNEKASDEDLFAFLTNPTPERDFFLSTCCNSEVSVTENIIQSIYTPK